MTVMFVIVSIVVIIVSIVVVIVMSTMCFTVKGNAIKTFVAGIGNTDMSPAAHFGDAKTHGLLAVIRVG